MSSDALEHNVSNHFNRLCIETFNEFRTIFESENASLNGPPLFGGKNRYICYNYDLENFQRCMQKYSQPRFTNDIGRKVLKTVLLEMNVFLPHTCEYIQPVLGLSCNTQSNLVSEILGRTIREQRLNGILRHFLEFLSLHHCELLRDVLNYRGYMRYFPGGNSDTHSAFVPMNVHMHLVYTMVYERGSVALLQFVAKLDCDLNHRRSIDNCEVYGKGLFEKQEDIWKIQYLTNVFGKQVLLAGDGILCQYIKCLSDLQRPFSNPYAVDMITTLVELSPYTQHPTSDNIMHMIVRTGAYPSASTPLSNINTMLEKLCAHLTMQQLTHTRDMYDRTVEYYANEYQLVPILRHIRLQRMRCCMLSQLRTNDSNYPCHIHTMNENTLQMIYKHL